MGLALSDIQGNIVPGFFKDAQDFIFFDFQDADQGRQWLQELCLGLSSAEAVSRVNVEYRARKEHDRTPPAKRWVNVALSAKGLATLGVDLTRFPPEFKQTPRQRAQRLGDDLGQQPPWPVLRPGGASTEPDALLILGANNDADMREHHATFHVDVTAGTLAGMPIVAHCEGRSLALWDADLRRREHFGFLDGLSQPVPTVVTDSGWQPDPEGQLAAPSEFILGAPDNDSASTRFHGPEWARNGSYLVFRRLRQLVGAFDAEMQAKADELAQNGVPNISADCLAAKMMGRPRSSKTVVESFKNDPDGDECPLFAHVRKANPRDSHVDSNRHRIIRRGLPYGPPGKDDRTDRGMLFVAYQADIGQQFEFLQTHWLGANIGPSIIGSKNGQTVSPLSSPGSDPLTGFNKPGNRGVRYHRPGAESDNADFVRLELHQFVQATGSGYFFCPSISGLSEMLNSQPRKTTAMTQQAHNATASQPRFGVATYYDLAQMIEQQRPYMSAPQLPDLLAPPVDQPASSPAVWLSQPRDYDQVEIFGSLAAYNQQNPAGVEYDPQSKTVNLAPGTYPVGRPFTIDIPGEGTFTITKGIRVPYKYTDVNGNDVFANILVLYNGNGH